MRVLLALLLGLSLVACDVVRGVSVSRPASFCSSGLPRVIPERQGRRVGEVVVLRVWALNPTSKSVKLTARCLWLAGGRMKQFDLRKRVTVPPMSRVLVEFAHLPEDGLAAHCFGSAGRVVVKMPNWAPKLGLPYRYWWDRW